jgi:hypothetical protein
MCSTAASNAKPTRFGLRRSLSMPTPAPISGRRAGTGLPKGSVNGLESVNAAELRKVKGRPPASLTAYDNYLLAVEAKGQFTKEAIFSGIDLATKAIALDPAFARAYAVRARLHYNTIHFGVGYEMAMRAMEADARRAVELDPNDPEARAGADSKKAQPTRTGLVWWWVISTVSLKPPCRGGRIDDRRASCGVAGRCARPSAGG